MLLVESINFSPSEMRFILASDRWVFWEEAQAMYGGKHGLRKVAHIASLVRSTYHIIGIQVKFQCP